MTVLYYITRFLTFPGAMTRGVFEHIVCKICGIPVENNRLLRADELCSHVEHELAPTSRKAFLVCFVPAFMNGLLALFLSMPSIIGYFYFEMASVENTIVSLVSYWFAFSLFVNSYPTVEDALNMKEKVYRKGTILQKIIYTPGFVVCYIGAFLEKYLVTFLLAVVGLVYLISL